MGTLFRAHHSSRDGSEFNHHCSVSTSGALDRNIVLNEGAIGPTQHEAEAPVEGDYFDGVFNYIQHMLMEEDDLDCIPYMFQDCMALQAAEKSFYDALTQNHPPPPPSPSWTQILDSSSDHTIDGVDHRYERNWTDCTNNNVRSSVSFPWSCEPQTAQFPFSCNQSLEPNYQVPGQLNPPTFDLSGSMFRTPFYWDFSGEGTNMIGNNSCSGVNGNRGRNERSGNSNRNEGKKNRDREDGNCAEERTNKQVATGDQEPEQTEKYDKALLCPSMNPAFYEDSAFCPSDELPENEKDKQYLQGPKRGRPKGSKKGTKQKEIVDLTDLLARCAKAEAANDRKNFQQLLGAIKQHSSPYGDARERAAHCFANALEARAAGTGTALYSGAAKMSAAEYLKAYQGYITACPFKRMSNIYANKSIAKLTRDASKIHIIDFGIMYGFQWPCIIHGISLRPGGPPRLKITGIDFPQPGFRPAERVEETGRRLHEFAGRFNVPFEYNAIAKRWETITLEDLKIEHDEFLVANCLYRMKNVPDESVAEKNNPRDSVLQLIKKIDPEFFVHGIINGTYNAPFFTTRFREACFHFSALFDMFEATVPREDEGRLLVERELLGRDVMNVIACEGRERVERPESYKQWQMRIQRAGFKKMALHKEIVDEVKAKVRIGYHRDFTVDECGEWMLQSWKGRAIYGLCLWRPVHH